MAENDVLEQIIKGCKAGHDHDFHKLIDLYARRCYGYFYRLCGNRELSDDLLSELFVKLVAKIGSYRGDGFEAWLFKTASNVFNDYLREKQHQRKLLSARKEQVQATRTDPKQSDNQQLDNLQIQLARLDADTRQVLTLRFYSQLSFREIAKIRSEPIGSTLSKVHRGLKKLRKLME